MERNPTPFRIALGSLAAAIAVAVCLPALAQQRSQYQYDNEYNS